MDELPRIEIRPDGPYAVFGGVPLTEMAPVHTLNGEPIAWHVLGVIATEDGPFELCRCGKSSTKPFCDDSHHDADFHGEDAGDRRPFDERASVEQHGELALADDPSLCVSAGFCGTRTTDVWKLLSESDDPAKAATMQEMIWRCPSGRLVLRGRDGMPIEPELPREIAVVPGGPLWVRGGILITSADGSEWEVRNRVALCRCGASNNKPFCDGAHESVHFDER